MGSEIPTSQKAWRIKRRGSPKKALAYDRNAPIPALKQGYVLIKIHASALNPVGYKLMYLLPAFGWRYNLVPEHDFSGVIVNSNDTKMHSGDEVFGSIGADKQKLIGNGTLCEYTAAPVECMQLRPSNITAIEAAGVFLAAETAFQILFTHGGLERGQSVLILGGSTSVGIYAIQIAKAYDCKVTATASSKKLDFVKSLGADEVIDYTKGDVIDQILAGPPSTKFNLIADAVGIADSRSYSRSHEVLQPSSKYVTTGFAVFTVGVVLTTIIKAFLQPVWLGGTSTQLIFMRRNSNQNIAEIRQLIEEGKLKCVVDSVFDLDNALDAYDQLMSNKSVGKVIICSDTSLKATWSK